jgi:adenosylcobinamide-GDP ribazoletransferase
MSFAKGLKNGWSDMLSAFQFLTRIPLPSIDHRPDSLSASVKFFPLVGACLGGIAALLSRGLANHLSRLASAFVIVLFLVLITGALHEDGLADAADGFGGGRTKEKILLIFRDSRIGSYGAAALFLSLVGRLILISELPGDHMTRYLIVAGVLSRWSILPLSYFLPAARDGEGQGALIARLTRRSSLLFGTTFAFVLAILFLGWHAIAPLAAAAIVTALSGRFYSEKIGGITGDCFGATTQIAETAVYLCGVWGA